MSAGRYGAEAVVTGEKKINLPADSHTRSVRWPAPLRASTLKEYFSKRATRGDCIFLKMSYHPCVSGCDRYLALRTVTIATSHAWVFSTLRKLLWMVHILLVETWPSSSCIIDSAMSNMAGCLCHDHVRITVRASPSGVPHPSSTPQPAGVPLDWAWDLCRVGYTPVSFCAPLMTGCRSLHRRALSLSLSLWGWWLCCIARFGCGSVVRARPRDERLCFLGPQRMSGSCGILNRIPNLRGCMSGFLGGGHAGSQPPPPPPPTHSCTILLEVQEELTRSWKAPFTARNKSCNSSPSPPSMVEQLWVYIGIPSVGAVCVHVVLVRSNWQCL